MHRSLLCLPALLATLIACDDAPRPDAPPIEPGVCGMTLPGVGTWTVARYPDGFLIDANREVALRTAGDDLWWYRLDGTGGGPVTLGAPYARDQRIELFDAEHVVVHGMTDDFRERSRLIRLADDRVLYENEWRFEGRGEWIVTGNSQRLDAPNPRLRSLKTGRSFELPCQPCSFVALDRFGRAWLKDFGSSLVEVRLATGRAIEHPDLWVSRANMAGAGLRVGRDVERLLFGAAEAPVTTCQRNATIASTGLIACLRADRLDILDRAGAVIRSVPDVDAWTTQEFGAGFITEGGGRAVVWTPFDLDAPVVRIEGGIKASTAQVAIIGDRDGRAAVILHADGRQVEADPSVRAVHAISADSTMMFARRDEDSGLVDLETGAVLASMPFTDSWIRFAGPVVLVGGAPLGESPPTDLGNLLIPDRACPAMLYEQCVGGECDLLIRQFEAPAID